MSLQTVPVPDTPWAFGILGDTQRNPEVTRRCAQRIYGLCGNTQFFMIDSNKDCGTGSEQYRWLEQALAQSRAIYQMTSNQALGVRYIVSGGGGGGLEQAAPQRSGFSIHVQRGHHYAFAAVHDRTIEFKAYDLEGRLFDTFQLTKAASR